VDGAEDLEERFLRQVFGQLAIPKESEGKAVYGLVVPAE
jgi:hypothetical protein